MSELKLMFDPMTIEHLGFKMYSHLPNAVAELVANSYDADATSVSIVISESGDAVMVADDGHGMSLNELQDNYLVIGRNRRQSSSGDTSESGRRKVAGRKGLGKLAVFGIGNRIIIETKRRGSPDYVEMTMVWDAIKDATGTEYAPSVRILSASEEAHFTRVRIEDLNRKSAIDANGLAESLARLFNHADADFSLSVQRGSEFIAVTRDLRYASIDREAEWEVPGDFETATGAGEGLSIGGKIIASRRPLPAHLRGVTLYVRGRMANEPEYFGVPESSHAFSYITGFIDADDLDESADVISTDRRAVAWDSEAASALHVLLADLIREAARKRRGIREARNKIDIDADLGSTAKEWTSTIKGPESAAVERVLGTLASAENDIEADDRRAIVEGIRAIAPEYADLHWRALHPQIRSAAEHAYKSENYHHAVVEAIKRYVHEVRRVSKKEAHVQEFAVIQAAFNDSAPLIDIVSPYASMSLAPGTQKDMRSGQKMLSEAVWTGFRNPIQHEIVVELQAGGAFSYQDCLDALSIVSHLYRRVEAVDRIATVGDSGAPQEER